MGEEEVGCEATAFEPQREVLAHESQTHGHLELEEIHRVGEALLGPDLALRQGQSCWGQSSLLNSRISWV